MRQSSSSSSSNSSSKASSYSTNTAKVNAPFGIVAASSGIPKECITDDELYLNIENEKVLYELAIKKLHYSPVWYGIFNSKQRSNPAVKRGLRIFVQMQTIAAIIRGKYFLEDGTGVLLNKKRMMKAITKTRMYSQEDFANEVNEHEHKTNTKEDKMDESDASSSVKVILLEGDCLDATLWMEKHRGVKKPAVLISASSSLPGGGYRRGAGAQEENLHRRTNLFQCLEDPHRVHPQREWSYPIPEFGAVYVPKAAVFRGSEHKGYEFFAHPKYYSFIGVAAYKDPPTEPKPGFNRDLRLLIIQGSNERVLDKKMAQRTKKKLNTIFQVAEANNHDCVILSAIGCGAYCNPPRHIAQLFREVIESRIHKTVKYIVFAIYDDHNAKREHNPNGNYAPFFEVLQDKAEIVDINYEEVSTTPNISI